MRKGKFSLFEKFKMYHFEFKHLLVVLVILVFFQILVSFIHKGSIQNLVLNTQDWYQQDSAERLANLSATSLELLLETSSGKNLVDPATVEDIVQAFNIILNQPLLQESVRDICILVSQGDKIFAIDDGRQLFDYFFKGTVPSLSAPLAHLPAVQNYRKLRDKLRSEEEIYSIREGRETFHVFVPFVPRGEYMGAVYVKNVPDFGFISSEIISSYDETALIFAALILLGFLAMFYISSYTVKERDEALQQLFSEREKHLTEEIHHQKEALFTKRIYHTHHKAEKVMGFIKEDLRRLSSENTEEVKNRVTKYANFISRVIYDMKWYDPPLQTIRNPLFKTDLNEVLQFIVNHIFMRVSENSHSYHFVLDFDQHLPPISINEFVVWEVVEPLIQNSIDHSQVPEVTITISTRYNSVTRMGMIMIKDNGKGIRPDLLQPNEKGIKKLFLENVSTKENASNSGYGCYLAYEISKQRCGWDIDAENLQEGGCLFTITIPIQR